MNFDGLPLAIAWELTLACNLRCRHCASSAGSSRAGELTLQESLDICDQFPDLLVQEVDFTGGEPLVREDWPLIAARLTGYGIRTQIITNGLALNQTIVDQMAGLGVSALGFSLDGLETTHDAIRLCKGLFQRVLAGIERVQRSGIPVTVITTVNSRNLSELPALLQVLKSAGVQRWQLQPIFPLGRSRGCEELLLTSAAYLRLGTFVQEWRAEAQKAGVRIELADSYGYFHPLDVRESPWRGCPAGLLTVGITSQGKIKGCLSLPEELTEGDLRQQDLWDIWFSKGSFAYNRDFSSSRLGPNCRTCDQADLCRGGCSAMSYGSTALFHNNPYCFSGIAQRATCTSHMDTPLYTAMESG
jgi:radical SAM protein with 4Fe4S-binding SPASM domain